MTKRYGEAAGFFKGALQHPHRCVGHVLLARQGATRGWARPTARSSSLRSGCKFDPGFAEAHYFLGQLYQQQKDDVNASYQFAQAAKLAPEAEPPAQALEAFGPADDWIAKAKHGSGWGRHRSSAHGCPCRPQPRRRRAADAAAFHGYVLVERGDLKDALDVYRQAAKLDPKNAEVKAQIDEARPSR